VVENVQVRERGAQLPSSCARWRAGTASAAGSSWLQHGGQHGTRFEWLPMEVAGRTHCSEGFHAGT